MTDLDVIGGEFRIDPNLLEKKEVNNLAPVYSLGRTCLAAILQSQRYVLDEFLCPDYICISVPEVAQRLGLKIRHYHISRSYACDVESVRLAVGGRDAGKAILLVSYFGIVDLDPIIEILRCEFPSLLIIVDDVQNYYGFGAHRDFDYCFSSYRKWFSVSDGADIIQKSKETPLDVYNYEPQYVKYKLAGNILKNYIQMIDDCVALELITKGEELMDESYLFKCSKTSRDLINQIDLSEAGTRRRKNALYLHKELQRLGIEHLYVPSVTPLFVPITVQNRDALRRSLFEQSIFAPVHWPIGDSSLQGDNELYHVELSLICDQRYAEKDMERIIRGIENAM